MTENKTGMAKTFRSAMATVMTAAAHSRESSTRDSTSSVENEEKRHFLGVFRRWEALFKRADRGDEQAEKWLIAEYYKSLRNLSPEGLETLTEKLKASCIFFPTVKECLDIVNVSEHSYDWGNPFRKKSGPMFQPIERQMQIANMRPYGMLSENKPLAIESDVIEDEIED